MPLSSTRESERPGLPDRLEAVRRRTGVQVPDAG